MTARLPRICSVDPTAAGWEIGLRLRPGMCAGDLERVLGPVAATMRVASLRLRRDHGDASRVTVVVVERDVLGGPVRFAGQQHPSVWAPLPLGVDVDGRRAEIALPGKSMLVGGLPGAGKSVAIHALVAQVAADTTAELWLVDGKGGVELGRWAPCACRLATDIDQTLEVIDDLRAELDERYQVLRRSGRSVWPPEGSLVVLAVDELAAYTTHPDRAKAAKVVAGLRDLVARGRAAGMVVIAATQRPSADVVPSSLRDLFGVRLALRCATPDSSDMILGAAMAAQGYSAAAIAAGTPGVGWLLDDTAEPGLMRVGWLSDPELEQAVARAVSVRAGHVWDDDRWWA